MLGLYITIVTIQRMAIACNDNM